MNLRISNSLAICLVASATVLISVCVSAQTAPAKPAVDPLTPLAPIAPAAPAGASGATGQKTFRPGVVKVGEEMKETLGRITDLDKGDNGCFLILRNDKNGELIELGKMEFCSQKQLKGKKVELEYKMETVQAASCYGDPKCKKTETVPLVVGVKVLE
jgi:hypothetical protein